MHQAGDRPSSPGPLAQPRPLRRQHDRGRVRRPAEGRGRTGRGPRRPGRCCSPDSRTRPRISVDQPGRSSMIL